MKLESIAAVIWSYVLLVCTCFLGKNFSHAVLARGLTSVEVFCCSNLWAEVFLEVPVICFIWMALRDLKSDNRSYISAAECFSIV